MKIGIGAHGQPLAPILFSFMLIPMIRSNHYEAAFEAYLRDRRVGFIAVDEAKRSILGQQNIKSADFIIVGPETAKLIVDVKGRRFPSGSHGGRTWQNWAEEDDIEGLQRWADEFGPPFRAVLAFVYHIQPPYELTPGTIDLFEFQDKKYLMRAIGVPDYRIRMKRRSEKWGTVHLPVVAFRELVKPFGEFLAKEI